MPDRIFIYLSKTHNFPVITLQSFAKKIMYMYIKLPEIPNQNFNFEMIQ